MFSAQVRLTRLNDFPNGVSAPEPTPPSTVLSRSEFSDRRLVPVKPTVRRGSTSDEDYEVELIDSKKNSDVSSWKKKHFELFFIFVVLEPYQV